MGPKYGLIDNNCQLFTLKLLARICKGSDVATSKLLTSWKLMRTNPQSVAMSAPVEMARAEMVNNTPTASNDMIAAAKSK